jgi:hypothetical protein
MADIQKSRVCYWVPQMQGTCSDVGSESDNFFLIVWRLKKVFRPIIILISKAVIQITDRLTETDHKHAAKASYKK